MARIGARKEPGRCRVGRGRGRWRHGCQRQEGAAAAAAAVGDQAIRPSRWTEMSESRVDLPRPRVCVERVCLGLAPPSKRARDPRAVNYASASIYARGVRRTRRQRSQSTNKEYLRSCRASTIHPADWEARKMRSPGLGALPAAQTSTRQRGSLFPPLPSRFREARDQSLARERTKRHVLPHFESRQHDPFEHATCSPPSHVRAISASSRVCCDAYW